MAQRRRGGAASQYARSQPFNLEEIRSKLGNDVYLNEAIQRLAFVLSNEIFELSQKEQSNGRK
ncbi:MAG: hypothetical protein LBB43_02975 [Spirochaetaceae bacterium]|jgi:hypothetical protein|nr:hypothetical protein [Spirochaetaceae bacterium]